METMVKLIRILVSSLFVMSCGGNRCASDEDAFLVRDTSINQFILRDTSFWGHLEKLPDIIDDPNIGEFIGFSNVTASEYLLLVRENGGVCNQYNYFCLTDSVLPDYKHKFVILGDSVFIATLGAYVGCSEMDFCDKYKELEFSVSQTGTERVYEHQDTISQYCSIYKFNDGYLTHMEFGYIW